MSTKKKKTATTAAAPRAGAPDDLRATLRARFEQHMPRHRGVSWSAVEARLDAAAAATLRALQQMEATGGEPDVIGVDKGGAVIFCDCAPESPKGRRSCCYDEPARKARKEHPPKASALGMAAAMGVEVLDEEGYQALQKLGAFDSTTSSWLITPADVRGKGGAIFGDLRFGRVFIYHNGADSYYGARGFRATLRV